MSVAASKYEGKLVRHGLLLVILNGIANVANVAFHMVMGRALTGDQYGILAALLNLMLVLATPLDALRNAMAHFAARAHRLESPALARAIARRWCIRIGLLAAPAGVGLWLLRGTVADFFHLANPAPIIVVSVFLPAFMLLPVLAGILQGLQCFWWFGGIVHGVSLLRLALGWSAVALIAATAYHAVLAQGIAMMAGAVTAFFAVGWVTRGSRGRVEATRGIGPYFLKAMLMLAGYGVLMNSDVMLVRHFHPESAGEFAWAATIGRSVVFLPMPIAMAMFPKVISAGTASRSSRLTALKALGLVAGMIAAGVAVSLIWPWLPLLILYGVKDPSPALEHLVRMVILAMSPLGISYLLLNFEMAQHRFRTVPWLLALAAAYIGGVWLWHPSVLAIVAVLGAAATASAALYVWEMLRSGSARPADAARPARRPNG
jgi:O-antigen/teichoic acid export membrane protein